jgi:AcrR family transcriptional regulator
MPEQQQPAAQDFRADREQQILEAAMAVFAREGFHQARMEDIARQSGLGKGTLYLYFKSKDAIIGALLRAFFTVELRRLKTLEAGEGSVAEQIMAYTRHMAAEIERMAVFSSIAYEFYAAAARDRRTRQRFEDYFTEYHAVLTRIVQRGIAAGEFRPVNAEEIAVTLLAVLEGLNLLNLASPRSLHLRRQAEASVRLILDAIRAG